MLRKTGVLILCLFVFLFVSCTSEESAIKQVVSTYQNAMNQNDKNSIIELFDNPSTYGLDIAFAMVDVYKEQGIKTSYTIDILEVKINGNIAEAKLKTSVKYSGEDKETIKALQMFTPTVIDSVMTLRKENNNWKIVAEKVIE